MSRFAIELTRTATKDLDRLPSADRGRIIEDLRSLQSNPLGRPPRIKRLKGFSVPLYRLRSSDYRVLYRIEATAIRVMRVINRKDMERTLRQFRLGFGRKQ